MAIGLALKAMSDAISRAVSGTKSTSSTSNSTKNSSSGSSNKSSPTTNYGNGSNYAYDPSGNKVNVTIKNGQSYLDDGNRVGSGYTVQTNGGIYKMGDDGKGIKVNSHNQYVAPKVASTNKNTSSNLDARSSNRYNDPITGYTNNYNNEMLNIYDTNKYDNSVLKQMFISDVMNKDNPNYQRYGSFEITDDMSKDYNVAYDELMKNINSKYSSFSDEKKGTNEGQLYLDAINRYKAGGESGNPNMNPIVANNYNPAPYSVTPAPVFTNTNQVINTPYVPIANNPIQTNTPIINNNSNYSGEIVPIDLGNGVSGNISSNGNGNYIVDIQGDKIQLSENDFINFMQQLTGI